jgi:hypothetical protein
MFTVEAEMMHAQRSFCATSEHAAYTVHPGDLYCCLRLSDHARLVADLACCMHQLCAMLLAASCCSCLPAYLLLMNTMWHCIAT